MSTIQMQEMREELLALIARDAYRHGEDVHTLTAKILLEKDSITSNERRLGKTINFATKRFKISKFFDRSKARK